MKRLISFFLVIALTLSMSVTTFAVNNRTDNNIESFSFADQNGDIITVQITREQSTVITKVYINGTLSQVSTGNKETKSIETVVYDLNPDCIQVVTTDTKTTSIDSNGFTNTVRHVPVSSETIAYLNSSISTLATEPSIYYEPVDNTDLPVSGYGDGYYYLGRHGAYIYAPSVYGYLYRKLDATYLGQTKHWQWTMGTTIGAISTAISLFGGPVPAILAMLSIVNGVLEYTQAIDLDTVEHDYQYKVRVNGTVYFTTERNITYWYIEHSDGDTQWYEKSFNWGFSMANTEMVKFGIDEYLASV